MKLPDVNVLLYAANVDSPRLAPGWRPHSRTRAAWAVPGSYCWVLCAWERGEAFCEPMSIETALRFLNVWLSEPGARVLHPQIAMSNCWAAC